MIEAAFAKLNLALHVRERLADGYHRIETLFAFAEDGDVLRVGAGDGIGLTVEGPFAASLGGDEDNLVLKAARALASRYRVGEGAALTLDKRLPVASGIGGGSADAAAALRLLVRWWGLGADEADLRDLAAGLGADVPACIGSCTVRGENRGDQLIAVAGVGISGTPVLLVNPGVAVSTAQVFRRWDGVDRGPLAAGLGRNDLQPAAIALAPAIGAVLEALGEAPRVRLAAMSGSGATCFALFDDEGARDAAAARIGAAQPSWWRLASRLR
jgi:4-diphosphocytidyl-2-C-methyl-D-erythritol kinase